METKINIAKILKDKPKGTKLYTDAFGELSIRDIDIEFEPSITLLDESGYILYFYSNGKYSLYGEPILFPSNAMQNWSKFAWKKGDLLVNSCGFQCIFKEWASDDYTRFNGCYSNSRDGYEDILNARTDKFDKLDNNVACRHIKEIERRLNGKLNLETLEIEKQLEFKDGDILVTDAVPSLLYSKYIFILKGGLNTNDSNAYSYIFYNVQNNKILFNILNKDVRKRNIRLATYSEKKVLFDALAKKGKRWNPDTKSIEDLPKKCEFKPMDWCLMKYKGHYNNRGWELCQYAYTEHRASIYYKRDFYHAVGGEIYAECIPYNDQTKHLLGTTDEWKGGEG